MPVASLQQLIVLLLEGASVFEHMGEEQDDDARPYLKHHGKDAETFCLRGLLPVGMEGCQGATTEGVKNANDIRGFYSAIVISGFSRVMISRAHMVAPR